MIIISTAEKPTTIHRDENDRYFVFLVGRNIDENNEEKKFFLRKTVQFKKGIELKNKSKIAIYNAFLKPYLFEVEEEGEAKKIRGDSIFILEFDLIEEGVDEKDKVRKFNKEDEDGDFDFDPSITNTFSEPNMKKFDDAYGYNSTTSSDDLPF